MTPRLPPEPQNVGISGIQIYYPRNVVDQSALEKFDRVSSGKYTIGLGQHEMGFCADNEDVVSISLTVTQRLIEDYSIDPASIGFLAVGSETLIDKSKSVKTELMQLFGDNHDIEGVDVKNACYGGTQAMFHAIDWVYSNYSSEKRNAIAVLADIAVYEPGAARCTGGAGAIAVLITPDAPIPFERGLRATYMTSSWDFYKPIAKVASEYPIVDGPVSLQSYMSSLEGCYNSYRMKAKKLFGEDISLSCFSAALFHSPFTRMVQKALARLAYRDYESGHGNPDVYNSLGERGTELAFEDREVAKILLNASDLEWKSKTDPNLELNRRIGNMYTPSLLAQLVAYLARRDYNGHNRLLLFAYGSGSASAMFSAKVNTQDERLPHIENICKDAMDRLEQRCVHSPQKYTEALRLRELFLVADVPVIPTALSNIDFPLFEGTYALLNVDDKYRRNYSRTVGSHTNGVENGIGLLSHGDN